MIGYEIYKNSKIEWIGDIPENWDLRKIKQYFALRSEKVDDKCRFASTTTASQRIPRF